MNCIISSSNLDIENLKAELEQERAKLIPKNDYNKVGNEYSVVNKDAMADGDDLGRGTGAFLDVYNVNAGTIKDVAERKSEIKINQYNPSKIYPNF